MEITWTPPATEEEEEKKVIWTPPIPTVKKEEEVAKVKWTPPKPKPIVGPTTEEQYKVLKDELSRVDFTKYEEPTWAETMMYAGIAGFADIQSMALGLGKLLSTGGVQVDDKVSDIFDKDRLDRKKDPLRKWVSDMVTKSETIAEDSWDKAVSKNRLKNFAALGGRAVPLTALTLVAGAMLVGAFPALVGTLGYMAVQMLPFATMSLGGHANRIEREFNKRGEEAPYLALLGGAALGSMAEVGTEVIPFQRFLRTFGGSKVINRGAKTVLKKYLPLFGNYLASIATETGQEILMVPLEKGINNILFDERENLFPKEEMIQAGTAGLAMSLLLGGLGSSNSVIRSFAENRVDKMMKLEITKTEGTLDILEKVVEEADPEMKIEEYLPEEPRSDESPQEQFARKNTHKVVPKFPRADYEVTDQSSLDRLGKSIAMEVGLDDTKITWEFTVSQTGANLITAETTFYKDGRGHIRIIMPTGKGVGLYSPLQAGELLSGVRGGSHGNLVKVILHELGHIAAPARLTATGKKREVHGKVFHTWTTDKAGKLWMETPLLSEAEIRLDKEIQKAEIDKARICEKYGLDPKDFKHTALPKAGMEEEDISKSIKDLQDAGYGREEDISKKKVKGKVDKDKVNVHVMTKDEFVKGMVKNKSIDSNDQEFANATLKAEKDELPAIPTPEGVQLSGRMKLWLKIIRGTLILDPSASNVYEALAEMEGTIAEAEYVCKQVRDTWEKMVPNAEDEALIDKYCDMPEKYQAEITEKGLQNEADWIRKQYKSLADIAIKAGVINAAWRNYSPFMFKNIHEWMRINPDTHVPVPTILGMRFAHGMERNIQNYDEAEALGLIPEHKVGLKLSQYMFSLSKVVAHRNFVDLVKNMTDESGHAVATALDSREPWAINYKQVNNPEFAKYMMVERKGKMKRVPIRWKAEVADAIEEIAVPPWMQSKPMKNIRMIKGIVKRIIFLNPAIHGWNIYSDVLDEVNFNFFEAWNAIKPGGEGSKIYLDNTRLTRESLRANLNLAHSGRIGRQMREEVYDLIPLEGKNVITKGIGKLFAWNDNMLWTTIVRNAQMYTYALKRKQGLTPRQAASFTNDLLGTLPKRYFTNFEWGVSTTFLLARNWTISNLRLLTGAIGPMANIIPIKALTRREMSPADMKALAPHYIRHLIKGMFGLIMLTNILNKLWTGKWAYENEPGHKLDLYTGMKDNKGRDMYIVMPLLRYMRDYLGWATQPRRTVWNKMEPVMKTSLELLINHSMWQNKKIMHPEAPLPEKIKDAAEYALWAWTPFDQFMDSENEVKTTFQKLAYFTGTWIRRGSSISSHSFNTMRVEEKVEFVQTLSPKLINELYGNLAVGRIYGEVAQLLYKFRSKKGYVKEKLDASIDKLLTGGDIPGAIELMVESGRYKNFSAIKDRIMPYLMLRK